MKHEETLKAAESVRDAVLGKSESRPDRACERGPYKGWDEKCRDPLHKQIWDRPMGMTD